MREKERQIRREYRRAKERERVEKRERRTATGLLLDAVWDERLELFVQRRVVGGRLVVCYFTEMGEVVPPSRMPMVPLERWRR